MHDDETTDRLRSFGTALLDERREVSVTEVPRHRTATAVLAPSVPNHRPRGTRHYVAGLVAAAAVFGGLLGVAAIVRPDSREASSNVATTAVTPTLTPAPGEPPLVLLGEPWQLTRVWSIPLESGRRYVTSTFESGVDGQAATLIVNPGGELAPTGEEIARPEILGSATPVYFDPNGVNGIDQMEVAATAAPADDPCYRSDTCPLTTEEIPYFVAGVEVGDYRIDVYGHGRWTEREFLAALGSLRVVDESEWDATVAALPADDVNVL